jgi:two-component system NtrC family sensor kinase
MEALGQLTGGIAHDFNNLLMVVSANAQTLKAHLSDRRDRRAAEAIELVAERGENLTRQLLAFSRRQTLNPVVIDLGRHVPGLRDLLASSARGDIGLIIDIPPEIWPVAVDVPEFELALVNLVVNARDATADSGTITIEAGNTRLSQQDTADGLAGDFVALAVSDTGCGIAEELQAKVFEPFFTTKEIGKGTGLGLSQVYGFTRQSGGTVTIRSRIGAGTTVTLYLPRSDAPAGDETEASPPVEGSRPGERVLLVEDNPEVRDVAVMLLEELGYEVVAADSAGAALRLLAEGGRIDLVMTDIVMPGEINGLGLAQLVRDAHPQKAVLLTTGYAAAAGAAAGFPILRKPYPLARLARAVRDALAAAQQE